MTTLYLDLETFSATPIKNGTYKYAADAEILLFAYAVGDAPAQVIDVTADPEGAAHEICGLMQDADEMVAHNSMFDRNVLEYNDYYPRVPWRDTMVNAYIHSLPGALAELCGVLGVASDKAKSADGKKLIQLFCKPLGANRTLDRATRETHPVEWANFMEYARLDVEAMREVDRKMPTWNSASELNHWRLDQRINDRGFAVDMPLVRAAIEAVGIEKKILAKQSKKLTGDAVASTTQAAALIDHITREYGITFPNMQKATIERRVDDPDLPAALRALLANRLQASTSSTSKYDALSRSVNDDDRLRGTLQFAGAARTGRWAGRTFQPQNLPRPTMDNDAIDAGIDALKGGYAELVTDNIMELTSSAIRGCIISPPGKKLIVSDLSNIEGRAQAWLAGETWKLKAFSDFDHGVGFDLYKLAYAKSFAVDPAAVTKDQRQIGKVQELALGYQGGVGAFATFATLYGIDLDDLANDAWHTIPGDVMAEAEKWLQVLIDTGEYNYEMSHRAFIVCDSLKRMWRRAHPNITALWSELNDAVITAIHNPGQTFHAGMLATRRDGAWLRIRLPSGRYLCYPGVRMHDDGVQYKGKNQYTRKWTYLHTYGGKLFENICQAVARDIMAENMHDIDAAGYAIVLTVHDEIISEAPDTPAYTHEKLSEMLAKPPTWANNIPLAAGGFETYRYKKD